MILQDIQIYPVKLGSNILTHNLQTHKYFTEWQDITTNFLQ